MAWTFLVAAGLIAIPVLIHIFNRTRYKRVNWAAMEFLLAAYRKTRRRLQLEHLILLLLRIMAMMFLAFAFFPAGVEGLARGAMNWAGISLSQAADGGLAKHLVLVIDDTASMQVRDANRSSYERAIERAAAMLSSLREGRDQVTLVRASTVGMSRDARVTEDENLQRLNREIRAMNPARAADLLAKSKPGSGRADMLAVIREAGRRVESIDVLRELPMVAIISDFQRADWEFASPQNGNNQSFVDSVRSLQSQLGQAGQQVRFVDVGPRSAANYAVLEAALEDPVVGVGIPTKITVKVGNFTSGTSQPPDIELRYRINQGEARAFSVKPKILPGETVTVSQTIPAFDTAGVHTIRVEVTNKDLWDADNSRVIAVNVINSVPIAIVTESENLLSDRNDVYILYQLLSVSGGEGEGSNLTPFQISLITPKSLDEASKRLNEFSVVIVSELSNLPSSFVQRLEQYVSEGAGSVIFGVGGRMNPERYNELLHRDGEGVLPAKLTTVQGLPEIDPAAKVYPFGKVDFSAGSAFERWIVNEDDRQVLGLPIVRQWMGVEVPTPPANAATTPGGLAPINTPRVVASLEADGSPPILISKRYGRGHSMLWGSTFGGAWGPLWDGENMNLSVALFVELVRGMAIGDRSRTNLEVGDHFVRNLLETELTALGNDVMSPDGVVDRPTVRTLPEDRRQLVYSRTAVPGLYRLRFLVDVNGETKAAKEELFTVSIPSVESDVARLGGTPTTVANPQDALKQGLGDVEFTFEAAGTDTDLKAVSGQATRFDVWLLLVGLAALFLLAEIGMSVWIGRRAE